jgi:hypothetical protein
MVANVDESDATIVELHVKPKGDRPVPFDNKFKGKKDLLYNLTSGEKLRCWVRDKELARSPKDDGHDGGPRR